MAAAERVTDDGFAMVECRYERMRLRDFRWILNRVQDDVFRSAPLGRMLSVAKIRNTANLLDKYTRGPLQGKAHDKKNPGNPPRLSRSH